MQKEYLKSAKPAKDLKLVLGWGNQPGLTKEDSARLNECRERLLELSFNELMTVVRNHIESNVSQKIEPLPKLSNTRTVAG